MRTADGWIAIAPYLDDRWVRLFEVCGLAHHLQSPAFADLRSRRKHMQRMHELVAELTPSRTTADWLALLKAANVPAMRVNAIGDLLDDPQLAASGLVRRREHPTEGSTVEVAPPVRFSAWASPEVRAAATVGQHSEEVARELGVSL